MTIPPDVAAHMVTWDELDALVALLAEAVGRVDAVPDHRAALADGWIAYPYKAGA